MTASATASPSISQRLRALERANHVRLARAELKRRIASGQVTAEEVIADCPSEAKGMPVADVLVSQRRWGVTRSRKLLGRCNLSETKTVGTLTERQRAALVTSLRMSATRDAVLV